MCGAAWAKKWLINARGPIGDSMSAVIYPRKDTGSAKVRQGNSTRGGPLGHLQVSILQLITKDKRGHFPADEVLPPP